TALATSVTFRPWSCASCIRDHIVVLLAPPKASAAHSDHFPEWTRSVGWEAVRVHRVGYARAVRGDGRVSRRARDCGSGQAAQSSPRNAREDGECTHPGGGSVANGSGGEAALLVVDDNEKCQCPPATYSISVTGDGASLSLTAAAP